MPDTSLVLASDARRTRETAELAFVGWPTAPDIRLESRLYAASPATMLDVLSAFGQAHQAVVMVGHNPGIGDLARLLSGNGDAEGLVLLRDRFPTAAAAILDFGTVAWSALKPAAERCGSF